MPIELLREHQLFWWRAEAASLPGDARADLLQPAWRLRNCNAAATEAVLASGR